MYNFCQSRSPPPTVASQFHHQCTSARTDIRELTERVRGLEGEKVTADAAISELKSVIGAKKAEADRERKRKERLESSLEEVKGSVEDRERQIRAKQTSVAEGNEELRQLEMSLREQKQSTDRALKEADTLSLKVQKLAAELEERTKLNSSLHAENVQRAAELKHAEAEIEGVKKEVLRYEKLRQAVADKVAVVDAKRAMADDQRDELKVLIAAQVGAASR
jgi:chromosome segregation ATPase